MIKKISKINLQQIVNKITRLLKKYRLLISIILFGILYFLLCFNLLVKEYKQPISQIQIIDLAPQWAINLGNQIMELRKTIPSLNQVVIVPDSETFLVAIQDWNLQKRYPILIEDKKYMPMFIRRFKPEKVIILPSVKTKNNDNKTQLMQQAVANAWNAENYQSLGKTWEKLGWKPPGIVITSENDSASLAAVALAADRGQPLMFLEEDFGLPNDTLNLKQWQNLQEKVENLVKNTGYSYQQLGDNIDTITLVKNLPVKYQSPQKKNEQLAVTDGLARDEIGKRWAMVGWIYGSSIRSVYMAMCSIFLDQKTAFLYNSYPNEKPWNDYDLENAQKNLIKMGMKVNLFQLPNVGFKKWLDLSKKPWEYDLIFINSRGNSSSFDVGGASALADNIPILKVPTAIHFIHSWSVTTPDDNNTVGGRWLENGAYAYVGSVHEPYLSAFIPPDFLVQRLINHVPFLIASRYLDSPPWKITTIGDPLMTIFSKSHQLNPKNNAP